MSDAPKYLKDFYNIYTPATCTPPLGAQASKPPRVLAMRWLSMYHFLAVFAFTFGKDSWIGQAKVLSNTHTHIYIYYIYMHIFIFDINKYIYIYVIY